MKRIRIFLRLKVEEIWRVLRVVMYVVRMVVVFFSIALLFTGVGLFILNLVFGNHIPLPEVIATTITTLLLSCFLSIIIKRWLQSNWEKAGEIAKNE